MARLGLARQGLEARWWFAATTGHDRGGARRGKAGHGLARRGGAWRGLAVRGGARPGAVGRGAAG